MDLERLRYLAALMAIVKSPEEAISSDQIRKIVDELISEGEFSDEFVEILESRPPLLRDVLEPFKHYLRGKGIEVSDREQAVWIALRYRIARIASRQAPVAEELERLINDVYTNYDFYGQTKKVVGDSHDANPFFAAHFNLDDLKSSSTEERKKAQYRQEIEAFAVNAAKDWIKKHGNVGALSGREHK